MALKKGDQVRDAAHAHVTDTGLVGSTDEYTEVVTFRLDKPTVDYLREHFQRRGLKLSQGVRMVLKDYASGV